MKASEQLVAAIRELRFAIDRMTDAELAETQPTARQALESQARALQADIERLLEDMGALESDLIN